jgi:plastocyanin
VTRRLALALAPALLAAALLGASGGAAAPEQATRLVGTVGPEFTITLEDAQGNRVSRLDPGRYEIEVSDLSDFHTFHLQGPGVNEATQATFTGKVTWTVTLADGNYVFFCDVHPSAMRGTFTSGTPSTQPPPGGGGGGGGGNTTPTKLVLTSGPSYAISLKTPAGRAVKSVKRGTYRVTVRDRSRDHNAHVTAPGYNRRTSVTFRGTQTWTVRLARTGTLRFLCDPHARQGMRGSARIVG